MTITSHDPVTLSQRDETMLEISAIIDEAQLSAEAVSTYDVANRVMEISREYFVEELKSVLDKQMAPLREMTAKLGDHIKGIRQPEITLPAEVVDSIRREITDNRD